MTEIDVDEISDVIYRDDGVEVKLKDGTSTFYSGPDLPEVLRQGLWPRHDGDEHDRADRSGRLLHLPQHHALADPVLSPVLPDAA